MPVFKNRTVEKVARNARTLVGRSMGVALRAIPRAKRRMSGKNGEISSGNVSPVFFVVGNQKSGTTWLMRMLDAHPEILCQGEGRPFGKTWRQEHLKELGTGYPPTSLYNAVLSSEDLRYWVERSVWTRRGDADEHLNNLTRLAIEYFLTQRLSKTGKRLVGDKTVLSEPGVVREISEVCPGAKVIHIVRDGRDVMVSQTHHKWNLAEDQGGPARITPAQVAKREAYRKDARKLLGTGEGMFPDGWLERIARKWSVRVGSAVREGPALLGADYAEVRYEDLLERPGEEIERLLKFLGAEADARTVERCVSAAEFEKLAGGRKRGQEAVSFFRKGIAGDWKNVFTEQDKRNFKEAAGSLLVELGYEKDGGW